MRFTRKDTVSPATIYCERQQATGPLNLHGLEKRPVVSWMVGCTLWGLLEEKRGDGSMLPSS